MYLKLQREFDSYDWYEGDEGGGEEGEGGQEGEGEVEEGDGEGELTVSRRSRESPQFRRRPPTWLKMLRSFSQPEGLNLNRSYPQLAARDQVTLVNIVFYNFFIVYKMDGLSAGFF